ncbi:hypothetical protein PGSY75_0720500 [Plasmodium gaboni]|uniref:Uncharacterized protein n=1 Tax=Plasmodium gaboni TaxID=647221 RepID=A0A151LQ23_9APIC|nr:hypothetical protein PGSY75_0720500 [Plasmodium gaboni]KYO01343.1 hypothetical protein PGSY75_0720500 [Plasmodium gaboni]SOV21990.1 conserved Plasmodium protein, unknown function [Plasmodium sp. DRC-Itaito]
MSYATCPLNFVNINPNQKEDLLRFEISVVGNYNHLKELETKSRIRFSFIILTISLLLYYVYTNRNSNIIIEILNNVPLVSFTIIFFYFVIKYNYKNLFKSKDYINSLNKTLKGFNLYLDNKTLKLCLIGTLRKE